MNKWKRLFIVIIGLALCWNAAKILGGNILHTCLLKYSLGLTTECDTLYARLALFTQTRNAPCNGVEFDNSSGEIEKSGEPILINANELELISLSKLVDVEDGESWNNELIGNFVYLYSPSARALFDVALEVQPYMIGVYGFNDSPSPVIMQIFANGEGLGTLSFDRGDMTWEMKCLWLHPLHWAEGHRKVDDLNINIRFVNDGGPNGSRDAGIGWIRFWPDGYAK